MLTEVKDFITENVFYSELFDSLDEVKEKKVINNAYYSLRRFYGSKKEISVEAIALQTIWLLQIDDTIRRSEQGITSISVNGISVTLSEKDRSISPEVIRLLGRRVGRYVIDIDDTFRHKTRPEYAERGY